MITNQENLSISDFQAIKDKFLYLTDDIVVSDWLINLPDNPSQRIRINFFATVLCIEGEIHVEINGRPFILTAGNLLIVFPTMQIQLTFITKQFKICLVGFSTRFLHRRRQQLNRRIKLFQDISNNPIIQKNDGQTNKYRNYAELIYEKVTSHEQSYFKEDILEYLFSSLLCELIEEIINSRLGESKNEEPQITGKAKFQRGDAIFSTFMKYVSEDNGKHRSLSYFADKMCYTSKYLSLVIKQVSGRSSIEWINEMAIEQIKYQLIYTDKPMKEIADYFEFPNQSFFGKYVKAHLGMSPAKYREEKAKG